MSSYYTEHNGLANYWEHTENRLELAKWVYHNPELLKDLLEQVVNSSHVAILEPMSDEDIDQITGVNINE